MLTEYVHIFSSNIDGQVRAIQYRLRLLLCFSLSVSFEIIRFQFHIVSFSKILDLSNFKYF